MKKKKGLPGPYAALTKDARFAGTYEVFIPVPDRAKAHRVSMQFESQDRAEAWIYSPEGVDAIAKILDPVAK